MRYVALLRGINVGGKTLIRMADLRACAEAEGLGEVSTYIASGNLLFSAPRRDAAGLAAALEAAIERSFGLAVKTVVLDRRAYGRIAAAIPERWIGDDAVRANVAFLRADVDPGEVVGDLRPDPAVEEIRTTPGAILWATRREALTRSVMTKLIGGAAYRELTVRNLNTTLKLRDLLGA